MAGITQQILEDAKVDTDALAAIVLNNGSTYTSRKGTEHRQLQDLLTEAKNGLLNVLSYGDKATLDADTNEADGQLACVRDDSTATNNGFYTSLSGVWTKIPIEAIAQSAANYTLSDYCKVRNIDILDNIAAIERLGISPSFNFVATPEQDLEEQITFTRASSGTYYDQFGILKTASANIPRYDFDPSTGEFKGLLVEGSRTNLFNYSEDATWSGYVNQGLTIETDSAVAPDGTQTADKWTENTGNTNHRIYESFTVVQNEPYAVSCYVKPIDRYKFSIYVYHASGQADDATFDLQNKTITDDDSYFGDAKIEELPNGWFRVSMSTLNPSDTGSNVSLRFVNDSDQTGYTSEDKSLYVWGMQMEESGGVTSYIKTEGSQVTRSADLGTLLFTDRDFFVDWNDGTLYCEFIVGHIEDTRQQKPFRLSDGSGSQDEFTFIVNSSLLAGRVREASNTTSYVSKSISKNQTIKAGLVKASGRQTMYVDGVEGDSPDAAADCAPPMTRLEINYTSGTCSIWIKKAFYTPFALSNTQLEQLTG
jgi:hypothetical protein